MRKPLLYICLVALFAASGIAHADPVTTFYISNGTFASGGTFSGSFVLDTSNDIIQSASILLDADGLDLTLTDGESFGFSGFFDMVFGSGDDDAFDLVITGSTTAPQFCFAPGCTVTGAPSLITDSGNPADGAVSGTISTSPTPEPSSLTLLGTGALGVLGLVRRKLRAA